MRMGVGEPKFLPKLQPLTTTPKSRRSKDLEILAELRSGVWERERERELVLWTQSTTKGYIWAEKTLQNI